jgi:hypothetical protein
VYSSVYSFADWQVIFLPLPLQSQRVHRD